MSFDAIASYMENVMCKDQGVPGCDIQIMRDHEILYRHICGFSDLENRIPLSENQLYFMYSDTKPITVSAAMRLIEEGRMHLDDPVSAYLPAFASPMVRDGDTVRPAVRKMTVRHLLTMSAGLDYTLRDACVNAVLREKGNTATTQDIIGAVAKRPLYFEPGDRFNYSMCHDVLAAVIEVVSGMRFSEYLSTVLFEPLGMTDSTFRLSEDVRRRLSGQYVCDQNHVITATDKINAFILSDFYESGGAGLITSTHDYALFADTMACGGTSKDGYRYLKPETIELLHTEQLHSFARDTTFGCAAGPGYGYGLGVRTRISHEGGKSPLGEFGWDGAAGAYVMMDTVNHLSISFSMHVCNWPAAIGYGHGVLRDIMYDTLGISAN